MSKTDASDIVLDHKVLDTLIHHKSVGKSERQAQAEVSDDTGRKRDKMVAPPTRVTQPDHRPRPAGTISEYKTYTLVILAVTLVASKICKLPLILSYRCRCTCK